MKIVVYTCCFGEGYGLVRQPRQKGIDYVCFTDQPLKPRGWKVIQVEPTFEDPGRESRIYKLMPHRFFPEYDVSIFIDSSYYTVCDVRKTVETVFKGQKFMSFDHKNVEDDSRDCIYDEYEYILEFAKTRYYKDDPEVMRKHIEKIREEGYPEHNGLIVGSVLFRRHNDPEVIKVMEDWWEVFSNGSKRDQLSFNYVCWKNNFSFNYLDGNATKRNGYFETLGSTRKDYTRKKFQFKLKNLLGLR